MDRTKLLQDRCGAVRIMIGALQYLPHINSQTTMAISFDGQERIKGKATQFVSLSLISGIIACRALLEFLGIKYSTQGLLSRSTAKTDDLCIEQFQDNADDPLKMVTPDTAIHLPDYQPEQAKEALELVIKTANKELAHLTLGSGMEAKDLKLFSIAGKITIDLMDMYFYSIFDKIDGSCHQ